MAVEHTVVQVRTIARTLFDSVIDGGIPEKTKRQIAHALSAASWAISSRIEELADGDSDLIDENATDDVRSAGIALTETLIESSNSVDQDHLVRGISLVSNIEIIADSLDETAAALHFVKHPEEPTMNKVIRVSPIDQTTNLGMGIWKPIKKAFRKYF